MKEERESTGNSLFSGGKYRLLMGLSPISETEWLAPDADLAETLAEKRVLLATRHDDVFAALPEASIAQTELLALLAEHLATQFPMFYQREGKRLRSLASGESWDLAAPPLASLDIASRLVAEDLCLLAAADEGYRLVGASLCAPNRWRLAEKLGQPLDAIHAPVPGYAPALQRPVTHFFAALKPARILGRVNWGITDDPARFQPIGRETSDTISGTDAGTKLWLRVERQSLRRLPESQAILFAIRTEITRLDRALRNTADHAELADAIRDMSSAMRRYKHLTKVAPALLEWLDARKESTAVDQEGVG